MHQEFPLVGEVFFALCKSADTPRALGLWLLYKYGEHRQLAEVKIDPLDYLTADSFKVDYLVTSYLSKFVGLNTGIDLEEAALQSFKTSEDICAETNRRIKKSRYEPGNRFTSSVIFTAKRKIADLLGPFSWFKLDDRYGWGPGAVFEFPRRQSQVDKKLVELPILVTPSSYDSFCQMLRKDLHWSSVVLDVSPDDICGDFSFLTSAVQMNSVCKVTTVPKSAKTHRTIAIENRGNGFLQKGFGSYFRERLKRVGINLDDQLPNQLGAKRALTDGLATLDLKSASDTVAIELVYELLPIDWAIALDDTRSKFYQLPDNSVHKFQKFSSMGNGFTFELESLIFWALADATSECLSIAASPLVYGDDIIVKKDVALPLIEVLSFVGFEVNSSKTFVDGLFYESCGKHFFNNDDVTPIYQKENVNDFKSLIRLGNRLIRYAHRSCSFDALDKRIYAAWSRAWRNAGPSRCFQLPLGTEGDDGWVLPAEYFDTVSQDVNLGLRCRIYISPSKQFTAHEGALLAWTLRRGVVTELPFEGYVSIPSDSRSFQPSKRWVMPTWEFGLAW